MNMAFIFTACYLMFLVVLRISVIAYFLSWFIGNNFGNRELDEALTLTIMI